MNEEPNLVSLDSDGVIEDRLSDEISRQFESPRARALKKLSLAAVGAIPWVGGFLAALVELRKDPNQIDELQRQWLEMHSQKLKQLQETLAGIASKLSSFGDEINERLESDEYLKLVFQAFQTWDASATEEKRQSVRRLLSNAAAASICSDDVIRLFIEWVRKYDDIHFRVIEAIYKRPGISRRDIWLSVHPEIPRDDSPEADLFKLLIHDLTLGHVIRQERATTEDGQYIKKPTGGVKPRTGVMKSPFDSSDHYELTELGSQFVHYVMDEVAPQLGRSEPHG